MEFVDIIVILVLAAIVGVAGWYIYKSKKSGRKCIGCPESGCSCSCKEGGCHNCSGCYPKERANEE